MCLFFQYPNILYDTTKYIYVILSTQNTVKFKYIL